MSPRRQGNVRNTLSEVGLLTRRPRVLLRVPPRRDVHTDDAVPEVRLLVVLRRVLRPRVDTTTLTTWALTHDKPPDAPWDTKRM